LPGKLVTGSITMVEAYSRYGFRCLRGLGHCTRIGQAYTERLFDEYMAAPTSLSHNTRLCDSKPEYLFTPVARGRQISGIVGSTFPAKKVTIGWWPRVIPGCEWGRYSCLAAFAAW
jgi:hypothetical protein